jgi:hypothetical protein
MVRRRQRDRKKRLDVTTSSTSAATEAGGRPRSLIDPPATFEAVDVERLLSARVCDLLDDPPPSAAGHEGDYRRLLAWWLKITAPQTEEDALRAQFAADLLWDLEHDRESLARRLPPFLIPRHPHVVPSRPPRDPRREELIQSLKELLDAATARAAGDKTGADNHQQKETSN